MVAWFYYDVNMRKQGPIDSNQLKTLVAQGIVSRETIVETDTGQQGRADNIKGLIFPEPNVNPYGPTLIPQNSKVDLLERNCNIYIYGIIAEILLCLLLILGLIANLLGINSFASFMPAFFTIFSFILLTIIVLLPIGIFYFWCKFLYAAWSIIPKENVRVTPNKAVGYCFIPFFSYYWVFVAYQGLPEGLNKTLEDKNIDVRASEGQGTALAVLYCWTIFPYLGILMFIVYMILSIFYIRNIKKAAVILASMD